MNINLFIIAFFAAVVAWIPANSQVTSLHFCGERIPVPTACQADSDYELTCDDFSIQWMYLEEDMLTFVPQQYVDQLDDRLKKFRKRNVRLISRGSEIDGVLISHKDDKEIRYKIIGFGRVNQQPVLIHLSMQNEPKDNEALPEHVRQFLELK